jgi:hypothetical protein
MTDEKDRRIRQLESQVKALNAFLKAGKSPEELASGEEPTDVTVVNLREMVAEARGRKSAEQVLTMARHTLRQVAEARDPVDRGAAALCLAAHALVIYERQSRQVEGN